MTLTQITKIRGPGIHTTSNIVSHNINSSGIITATAFVGDGSGLIGVASTDNIVTGTAATFNNTVNINGDIDVDGHTNLDNVSVAGVSTFSGDATFSGNVSIGGTLTYEDVTNIDAVGLVTARAGVNISDTTQSTSTTTGALKVAGGAGIVKNLNVGGDATFNGNSTVSGNYFDIQNNKKLRLGTNGDCAFYYNGSATLIETGNKIIHMQSDASIRLQRNSPQQHMLVANAGGSVDLYHSGTKRFETTNTGAVVTGILTATSNVEIAHGTGQAHYQITQTNGNTVKMGIVSGSDFEISGSSNNNIIFKRGGSTRLTVTSDGATVTDNLTANAVISSYGGIVNKLGFISGGAEGYTGTTSNHSLFVGTAGSNRIKIANNSAATSIGGAMAFNAMLTVQGDLSGAMFALKAAENTNRLMISGTDSNGVEINLYDGAGGQKGILGVSGSEFFIKAPNNSAPLTFYTHNGSSIGERLRITSAGRVLISTTDEGHGNADDLTIATAGGSLGHTGITIRSGTGSDGNIFFSDATSGSGETIGGIKYTHGGAGSNAETLNFIANGLTRATVSATAFWVDDGTNARLKLAPDSATLNMIISTTTGNGSYCNLLYGAADHIFKYGGTETARLTTAGNYTITGEFASAQDYPTIRPTLDLNFAAVKKLDPRITFYGRSGGGSYVDKYGIVQIVGANTPRFHHDPVTRESKGLLIEPNVANWIKYGTDLNNNGNNSTDWGLNNVTHTIASTVVGPDGKTGGVWEQKENSSSSYHASYYSGNIPLTNNQYYSISSWVKKGPNYRTDINSGNYQFYCTRGTGSVAQVTINSNFDGFASHSNTTSRSITQYPNGWVRVTYSFQSNATISNAQPHWLLGSGGSYAGNGASSVYIWGCQLEQLTYPTTYIHTEGSVVYRGTESCLIDGTDFSDFYNTEESSLYVEGNIHVPTSYSGQYNIVHIGDNNNDGHGIFRESGTKDAWYHLRSGGNTPSGGNLNPSAFGDWGDGQSEAKIAIAFKSGDQAISINGGNQVTATVSSSYPSANIRKMWIGASGDSGQNTFCGTISRITYYPKYLTDAQLNILTA